MKLKTCLYFVSMSCLLGASASWADDEDLDVTIMVVDEDDTAEATFELIALPEAASVTGVEKSDKGLSTANQARQDGKDFGQAKAAEAKQKGEAAKQNARDAANNAAEHGNESIKDAVSSKIPDVAQDRIPRDVRDAMNKDKRPDLPPRGRGNN